MLERRPRPGGKTIVDHPRNSHDDYANSLAIAAAFAKKATVPQGFPVGVGTTWVAQTARMFGSALTGEGPRNYSLMDDGEEHEGAVAVRTWRPK